jgi:hypothetical protein
MQAGMPSLTSCVWLPACLYVSSVGAGAVSAPATPGGGPALARGTADLDVVLTAFMRLWEEGVRQRVRSMNGMYATATGRTVSLEDHHHHHRHRHRAESEANVLLQSHDWNPAVAALSSVRAVSPGSSAVDHGR